MIADLSKDNRSCRRFYQNHPVTLEILKELVNLGRLSASGANRQPLKYILSRDPSKNAQIVSCLAWTGYLKDWPGSEDGERPAAYIVILRYWRDKAGIHHVPKRKLDDIIMGEH